MLYNDAMSKLIKINECTMDIKELNEIRKDMAMYDTQCLSISLLDIETLWYRYSDEYMASCLVVNDSTINEFIEWLR